MANVRELRTSYHWLKSASAVCGNEVARQLNDLAEALYFTIQSISYQGIQSGKMVHRPDERRPNPWILTEVIDGMSAQVSTASRADLGAD